MKQIVGHAEMVKVRQPFKKSRWAWSFENRRFMLNSSGPLPKGAVCVDEANNPDGVRYLDLSTGDIYKH